MATATSMAATARMRWLRYSGRAPERAAAGLPGAVAAGAKTWEEVIGLSGYPGTGEAGAKCAIKPPGARQHQSIAAALGCRGGSATSAADAATGAGSGERARP